MPRPLPSEGRARELESRRARHELNRLEAFSLRSLDLGEAPERKASAPHIVEMFRPLYMSRHPVSNVRTIPTR